MRPTDLDTLLPTALVLAEEAKPLNTADEALAERAHARARAALRAQATAERKTRRKTALHRLVMAAACVVLTAALGLTAALAASPGLRAQLVTLLQTAWGDAGRFHREEASVLPVAAGTAPAWLPEGMSLVEERPLLGTSCWQDEAGRRLYLCAYDSAVTTWVNLQQASVSAVEVNGRSLTLVESREGGVPWVTAVWTAGDAWYELDGCGLTAAELLQVVASLTD